MCARCSVSSFEELAATSFQIIAAVGTARSLYIEAIQQAKAGDFDAAEKCMAEAADVYVQGHDAHTGLVQAEAAGVPTDMCLMLTHAEDQLMSAEGFGILAREFIDVYKTIKCE